MAKPESDKGEKKRVFSRSRNYIYSRFRPGGVGDTSRAAFSEGARSVASALRPQPASLNEMREGYRGRYEDGGRRRFAEMCHEMKLTAEDLDTLRAGHLKYRNVYMATAAGSFSLGMAFLLSAGSMIGIMGGALLALFTVIFGGLALKGDYSAWQIAHRRFGGLRDYLDNRNAPVTTTGSAIGARRSETASPPAAKRPQGPKVGG